MLNRIGQQDQNEAILQAQRGEVEKIENRGMSNPYARLDKAMLIDESNISDDAISLYTKELDVKKFTQLALSDADDVSADNLVMQKVFNNEISIDDNDALYSVLNSKEFLKDVGF